MNCVEVLVDLPLRYTNNTYTYRVPDSYLPEVEFGKRVIVELGNKEVEGFVVSGIFHLQDDKLKSLKQVLDSDPAFNRELLNLADWMAQEYVCSITSALKSMLPPILRRKTGKDYLLPLLPEAEYQERLDQMSLPVNPAFTRLLYQTGDFTYKQAVQTISEEEILRLAGQGLVKITGKYRKNRPLKAGMVYQVGRITMEDLEILNKRAPRQAVLLTQLLQEGETDQTIIDKEFGSGIVKPLISKGFIIKCRKTRSIVPFYHQLETEQQKSLDAIESALNEQCFKEYLLFGVTASGKTEVYMRAIRQCLDRGRSAMMLVPEIALARHLLGDFQNHFKDLAVLHSRMSAAQRYSEWCRIRSGEARLVIGTRSAVFAPLSNLGLIIIDEEHENTYKQEETPRYHAGAVARKRAELNQGLIVYGSATPSIESFYRAMQGEAALLTMSQRIAKADKPTTHVLNMRNQVSPRKSGVISQLLEDKIASILDQHLQCILFLNRRGYSPMSLCKQCGQVVTCPSCSVALTYHNDLDKNICHYCNYQEDIRSACSRCGSRYLQMTGHGTKKVEEEIRQIFPRARIDRLDIDSSQLTGRQEIILENMKNRKTDILIGTQMVAKGLDFPEVALVGIIDADSMLNLPDFRATEKAFQLLVQVSGRAGRAEYPGEIVIQTYNPEHWVIDVAKKQDYFSFYREEITARKMLNYPPFTSILRIVVTAPTEEKVRLGSDEMSSRIFEIIDAKEEWVEFLGPAPCPVRKIRNKFRYQIILKCDNVILLKSIGEELSHRVYIKECGFTIDINPLNMM